jgi:hypothetical protein
VIPLVRRRILYNPTIAGAAQDSSYQLASYSFPTRSRHKYGYSFVTFVTLALAGIVVASVGSDMGRRELKMESSLQKRDAVVDCTESGKAAFLSAS